MKVRTFYKILHNAQKQWGEKLEVSLLVLKTTCCANSPKFY